MEGLKFQSRSLHARGLCHKEHDAVSWRHLPVHEIWCC